MNKVRKYELRIRKLSISLHLLRRLWRGGFARHRRGRQQWREACEALGGLPQEARGVRVGGWWPDASRFAVVEVQRQWRARGRAIKRRRALQRAAQRTEQRRLATLPRSLRANVRVNWLNFVAAGTSYIPIKPAIRLWGKYSICNTVPVQYCTDARASISNQIECILDSNNSKACDILLYMYSILVHSPSVIN